MMDVAPAPNPSRRAALRALGAFGAAALTGPAAQARPTTPDSMPQAPALRLLAHGSLPANTTFKDTLVGGLSGLAWDAQSDLWYALSDDRSRHAPARCYVLRLPPLADGKPWLASGQPLLPQWVDVITLKDALGQPWPRHSVDPEALALRRDAASGALSLIWASEGDIRARVAPSIHECALDGRELRSLTLPRALRELGSMRRGPRHNETLEGLAITPGGRHVWAAMEGALAQDRDRLNPGAPPGPCRLTRFDLASGRADQQLAYLPDAQPFGALMPQGMVEPGIADILMADADRMWVLERAWTPTTGMSVRLFEADLSQATNTLGMDSLRQRRLRTAPKRLLLDLRHSGLPHVDNIEAMSWGPVLPSGRRSLVMCSDDNFNPLQVTQFAAFEVNAP